MNNNIFIRVANNNDISEICNLASLLYKSEYVEIFEEFKQLINSKKAIVYVAEIEGNIIAFAQFSLRFDYVEGTNSSPVGYIEGIYVKEEYRYKGIATRLINMGENWAKQQGCKQMASDCEISNKDSFDFHIKIGYTETNKIVCFKKEI